MEYSDYSYLAGLYDAFRIMAVIFPDRWDMEQMADRERQTEVGTVAELLDEIESENLYQVLVAVDGRTLKIVLLKMQGYSTKEIAPLVHLTTGAIYARLDHLRKKLRKFYSV